MLFRVLVNLSIHTTPPPHRRSKSTHTEGVHRVLTTTQSFYTEDTGYYKSLKPENNNNIQTSNQSHYSLIARLGCQVAVSLPLITER